MTPLSRREMEVLYLRTQGLFNWEIAARLSLAVSTVANYVHSAMVKLETKTVDGAIWKLRRELEAWEAQHAEEQPRCS
ncbi:MAG: helix-turn-helix transcriptional regulator [Chloroflexota bacterium]|nr:helix-turn-helix transcriptional regulator [Chloroflexota bacterium]